MGLTAVFVQETWSMKSLGKTFPVLMDWLELLDLADTFELLAANVDGGLNYLIYFSLIVDPVLLP